MYGIRIFILKKERGGDLGPEQAVRAERQRDRQ